MALTADKKLFYEKSETWKRYFENDVVLSVLKEEIESNWDYACSYAAIYI